MKKIYLFLTLMFFSLGVGNAWGAEATINFSEKGLENSVQYLDPFTIDANTTITFAGGGNDGKYYNTGTGIRTYGDGTITVECTNGTISEISFTWSGTSYKPAADVATPAGYSTSTDKWTGSASSVTLTRPSGSGNWRLQEVTVTYETAGGGENPGEGGGETPDPEPGTGGEALSFTWDLSTKTYTTGTNEVTWTTDGLATMHNSGNNATNYLGGDANNRSSSRFYTDNTLSITPAANVTITSVEFTATSTNYANVLKNSTWTNASTNVSGTTVTVTPTNGASAISATISGTCGFTGVTVHYTKAASGEPETPTPSVSVTPTSHTFATTNVGETATQEFTITTENTAATLSASIDNTTDYAVSAIAGDKVTVTYQPQSAGTHSAVLTVKAGEEATATVNLTGKAVQALEGTWILVTDASSLKAGDEIIIASKDENYALSTTQNGNNRGQVEVTKTDNTITATSEAQVLTLQAGTKEGTLALYTGAGYLHAASSSSNYLRTETTLSDNSSWTIAIADGTATLIAQGTNTKNTLYYNKSSKIFSCYNTAQQPIALYKNTNGQQLAGLAYTTTKYLTKLGDAFATPALTNPNSLTVTYSSSDNNVATVAADGAVTIKAAGVVKITASFAGNSSFLEGSASYTIGVTEHAGTQADPYSVADARRVIDVMETAEGVYATGIVSEIVTAYNSTYGNISYNISANGLTTSDQLQAYRGKSYDGANFTSADDVKVGDEVVIKGTLKKYSATYEFDENNQLVSLNRTKEQAGLAYAETEHTANVGEDFAEPTLTNPNSLSITYSSSNTALATVDATTGEVSILAAGKVTITASSAADATYAAGSASYNITISDPSLAVAQLPFTYNSGKADIETTAGITQEGLGSDYSASSAPNSQLKFDNTGDWVVIRFDSEPEKLSYDIKNNSFSGGTFSVQESADGETYTDVKVHTEITETQKEEHTLLSTSRYVKFIYTEKVNGNVGLGNIKITEPDLRQEASLAWNPISVTLTQGDAFTAPTFSNPNSVTGITFTSDNETLATVDNAGVISLVSGKTGTATITATYAGNETYKPAEVKCTITVNPKTETVVILAQYNDQWYALKNVEETAGKVLAALPVNYVGGKLYNVEEANKATIEWQRASVTDGIIFKNGENYISGTAGGTDLKLSTTECAWTLDGTTYKLGNRTFFYNETANGFKNYNTSNAGNSGYSNLPVVTAPVYGTGTITKMENLTPQMYGTICLENNVVGYEGITFYKVAGKEDNKVIFDEVTELVAGMPYIYIADSETATIVKGNETAAEAGYHNSLQGTFTQIDPAESNILTGNYILYNNVIKKCGKNCGLKDHKAYFIASELEGLSAPQAQMPGRRRVSLNTTGENAATGIGDVVVPTEQATKVIINGQLIIIRDGVKYNVQGQKL